MTTATTLRKNSFRVEAEAEAALSMEKQGIVSILGADYSEGTKPAAASFRRSLSADMSSKKWLAHNGFRSTTLKRIASSEQLLIISVLDSSSSSEEEEQLGYKNQGQKNTQDDVWSSIISQNKTQEFPPPYVHPLVKKSSSSLSKKSLEICTESLGSETGSDGFSSSATDSEPDESSDKGDDISPQVYLQSAIVSEESPAVAKSNHSATSCRKVVHHRSFPPPLPSLTRSSEGPSLHMHSHRENGRLVLEAVSVPCIKNFHAQRQDGRLRLTLLNPMPSDRHQVQSPRHDEVVELDQQGGKVKDTLEEAFDMLEREKTENEIKKVEADQETLSQEIENNAYEPQAMRIVMEIAVPKIARMIVNVHRSAFIVKQPMGLENQKPPWTRKFNYTPTKLVQVDVSNEEEKEKTQLPQSLWSRPRAAHISPGRPVATDASLNAYEYFWRTKPMSASLENQTAHDCVPWKSNTSNKVLAPNKLKASGQEHLAVLRNCQEAWRAFLSWEPYCIATS